MAKWFEQAFGATVDEARNAIADIRAKLLDEAWFGRKTPEPHRQTDLGWTLSDRDPDRTTDEAVGREAGDGNFLDRLFETNPEFFVDPPKHEPEHGIDR